MLRKLQETPDYIQKLAQENGIDAEIQTALIDRGAFNNFMNKYGVSPAYGLPESKRRMFRLIRRKQSGRKSGRTGMGGKHLSRR